MYNIASDLGISDFNREIWSQTPWSKKLGRDQPQIERANIQPTDKASSSRKIHSLGKLTKVPSDIPFKKILIIK